VSDPDRVRLDKWLWAARFFRTRAKARAAIEGGKVECEGQRAKPAREIAPGAMLKIRQGFDEMLVRVIRVSEARGAAPEARTLYEETPESVEAREAEAVRRRARREAVQFPSGRPERRDRRELERIKKRGGL
jgi:ribosome-associated heat shock protein Hsp15